MSMLVEPPPMTAGERSRGDSSSGSSTTEPIAARVKRYSATINASVSKRQLSKLKLAVHEEAKEAFENTEFDVALEGFAHAVALNDAAGPDPDFRSALCYNIASCLHFMHDLELAKAASPPPPAPHPDAPRSTASNHRPTPHPTMPHSNRNRHPNHPLPQRCQASGSLACPRALPRAQPRANPPPPRPSPPEPAAYFRACGRSGTSRRSPPSPTLRAG